MKLSPATKQLIGTSVTLMRLGIQYGFVPFIVYLGYRKGADTGMPPLEMKSLLWG